MFADIGRRISCSFFEVGHTDATFLLAYILYGSRENESTCTMTIVYILAYSSSSASSLQTSNDDDTFQVRGRLRGQHAGMRVSIRNFPRSGKGNVVSEDIPTRTNVMSEAFSHCLN